MKILCVSLGCDKNLVDTEMMLGLLNRDGHTFTDDENEADIIVINTCCFINDAKEESVNTILEMAELKKTGKCKALIVTGCMAQRYKEDVLTELPPKRRLVMPVESDDAVYRRLMEPVRATLARLKNDEAAAPSQRALWKMAVESGERQATGMAKAPYVAQFVRALLDAGERVLLFAHHHQVMDLYKKELKAYSPAFITGRETPAMKEHSVERFMAGRTDLCCLSLRAAAGLNLQRASCVVFGELDWSPAVHSQAEDRAHRMGQTDSILCYYLVSQGGSDQDMQDALGLKVSQFVGLMGDEPPAPEDELLSAQAARQHIEQLVARLIREAG